MIIAKNYLKGWFIIDAVSAMPYDLILFGSGNIDVITRLDFFWDFIGLIF